MSPARILCILIIGMICIGSKRSLMAQGTVPLRNQKGNVAAKDTLLKPLIKDIPDSSGVGRKAGRLLKKSGFSQGNLNLNKLKEPSSGQLKSDLNKTEKSNLKNMSTGSVKNGLLKDSALRKPMATERKLKRVYDSVGLNKMKGLSEGSVKKLLTKDSLFSPKRIYSNRKLRAMYDSMGVGKMDTLLALASNKKEVPTSELLKKIESAFGTHGSGSSPGLQNNLADLSSSKLQSQALQQLPPMSGAQLKTSYRRKADSLLKAHLKTLDSLTARRQHGADSIQRHYRGDQHKIDSALAIYRAKSYAMPSRKKLEHIGTDSLNRLRNKYHHPMDSMTRRLHHEDSLMSTYDKRAQKKYARAKHKSDSLQSTFNSLSHRRRLPQDTSKYVRKLESRYAKAKRKEDSLRNGPIASTKGLKMTQRNEINSISTVVISHQQSFVKKFYGEGIVSPVYTTSSGTTSLTAFRISPSLAYVVTRQFSVGAGPNLLLGKQEQHLKLTGGLRSFAKYELWKQKCYVQVEDWLGKDPKVSSANSILVGGGGLIPLSRSIAINVCLLYRVNPVPEPSPSPWVFRIGLSSISNNKTK